MKKTALVIFTICSMLALIGAAFGVDTSWAINTVGVFGLGYMIAEIRMSND